ncbi:MAG: 3-phosphoshikimate 1-carboxyvinyltransferase [Acidimicrobiales bacterium]
MAPVIGPCVEVDGDNLVIAAGRPVTGEIAVPGDKSISHRAIMLSLLAHGKSTIAGLPSGDDVARTLIAGVHLGVDIRQVGGMAGASGALGAVANTTGSAPERNLTGKAAVGPAGRVEVYGGRDRFREPGMPLDMGNSGTGMRLLAGILAGFPWTVRLTGDESLSTRPMHRIAVPLEMMGAVVSGSGKRCHAPLTVIGGELHGIDFTSPQPSAQVKSAVLLAGLSATGRTTVREQVRTRTHTEELLAVTGASIATRQPDAEIDPAARDSFYVASVEASELLPLELDIPGDPSQAAYFVIAALVVPGSEIRVGPVYTGDTRTGFLEVLKRMGASVDTHLLPATSLPVGYIEARHSELHSTRVEPREIASLVDEVPVLAVAAAVANGVTVFEGVGELRVKESNRLEGTAQMINSFGGRASVEGDSLVIEGVDHLDAGTIEARGDHRIVMAGAVAALAALPYSRSIICGYQAVSSSYPGFAADLCTVMECAR